MLGLVELLLVFGAVFGFGFWQLHSLRRLREREQSRDKDSPDSPDS
jgi:hypothetical protein